MLAFMCIKWSAYHHFMMAISYLYQAILAWWGSNFLWMQYGQKDKVYDDHFWCTSKTTNIQNDFRLMFGCSIRASHPMLYVSTFIVMLVIGFSTSVLDLSMYHFLWGVWPMKNLGWNVRHVILHLYVLLYAMLALFLSISQLLGYLGWHVHMCPTTPIVSLWTSHTSVLLVRWWKHSLLRTHLLWWQYVNNEWHTTF